VEFVLAKKKKGTNEGYYGEKINRLGKNCPGNQAGG